MLDRRRVLLVSAVPTHPPTAGNRRRVLALLECMEQLGVDYHFAFLDQEPGDLDAMRERWSAARFTCVAYRPPRHPATIFGRLGNALTRRIAPGIRLPMHIDDWACPEAGPVLRGLAESVRPASAIVVNTFHSWILPWMPAGCRKLIDTQDRLANRFRLFRKIGGRPEWFSTTKRQERKGLMRADCLIAIQEREAAIYRQMTSRPVVTVGHITPVRLQPPPGEPRPTVLFLASNNGVNRDGIRYCFEEIWPRIRARIPAARLVIVGNVPLPEAPLPAGVEAMGVVPDLEEAYRQAHVVISPLRFGTGLKIKCIEALGFGRALVTTPSGAEGLEKGGGTAFLVKADAASFAAAVTHLIENPDARDRLSQAGLQFAESWNRQYLLTLEAALFRDLGALQVQSGLDSQRIGAALPLEGN